MPLLFTISTQDARARIKFFFDDLDSSLKTTVYQILQEKTSKMTTEIRGRFFSNARNMGTHSSSVGTGRLADQGGYKREKVKVKAMLYKDDVIVYADFSQMPFAKVHVRKKGTFTTVEPKEKKAIAIPFDMNLARQYTRIDDPTGKRLRHVIQGTGPKGGKSPFVYKSKSGEAFLAIKQGGRTVPVFLLKRFMRISPTIYPTDVSEFLEKLLYAQLADLGTKIQRRTLR